MQVIKRFFLLYDGLFLYLLGALLAFAASLFLSWLITKKLGPRLAQRVEKRAEKKDSVFHILFNGFALPLRVYIRLAGLLAGLLVFSSWQHRVSWLPAFWKSFLSQMPGILLLVLRILTIACVGWGLIRSSAITGLLVSSTRDKLDLRVGKSVRRFLSAIYNVVVAALTVTIILSELGIDINGLIAGLGLGGLTIALAAKDSASNFLGGLVIVTEKPFEIGDWIDCQGITGTVEDINLRSSKIRTGDGALTIVPNSLLSGAAITNWSGTMKRRKASFTLQLVYSTTRESMQAFCTALRALLENDEEVNSDSILVRFSAFDASSLNVTVTFNTALPGYADHMRIKERINLGIMEIAANQGIRFAFPTQSLYVESKP